MKINPEYFKELKQLQKTVYKANMLLKEFKLIIHTWGNASGITEDRKYMVIKPSGIDYDKLKPSDMVITDLENNIYQLENDSLLKPSTDAPTHTVIYKEFPEVKGIVHTHSPYSVAFAQSGKNITCFGTTHADNFYGPVYVTRDLTQEEISKDYEHNTGLVIVETFKKNNINYKHNGAILVKEHGPFVWSLKDSVDASKISLTLEEIAKIAINTIILNQGDNKESNKFLQEKHFNRKHGKNAYYGQKK